MSNTQKYKSGWRMCRVYSDIHVSRISKSRFSISAFKVQDSATYRNTEITKYNPA
jgi:hypothetical protein